MHIAVHGDDWIITYVKTPICLTSPLAYYDRDSVLRLTFFLFLLLEKKVKTNILTSILSSKYFFQIRGFQTFPCQGPPKLHRVKISKGLQTSSRFLSKIADLQAPSAAL